MSSFRHFSDGRRQAAKAPEKSNFLQTCNLLSQYIKEKGSLRDLNLEIGGKVESLEAIVKPGSSLAASASAAVNSLRNTGKSAQQTSPEQQPSMDLSPYVSRPDSSIIVAEHASNKTSTSKEVTTTELKNSQLTIFYSGRVLVFDDYPADKARELVSIAKKSSSQMSYGILSNTIQEKPSSSPREGLPPRPQSGSGKQPASISSNTCKEKPNPSTSGAVASSSGAREGLLPPPPQAAGGKQPVGVSSNTCKDTANPTAVGAAASTSKAGQKQLSPQSEANGSGN